MLRNEVEESVALQMPFLVNCIRIYCIVLFFIMPSAYIQFVKAHIGSAPGKTQAEKMKAVGAMWRRQKSGGKGLSAPGTHGGRVNPLSGKGVYRPGPQMKRQK